MVKDTKDVIRQLPIKEDLKNDLISRFDTMSAGDKHDLMMLVYGVQDAMLDDLAEERFTEKLEAIAEGRADASPDTYDEAVKQAQQDMLGLSEEKSKTDELSDVRNKLQTIISSN